jgi:DNA-binding Xre family transcriptional regulator
MTNCGFIASDTWTSAESMLDDVNQPRRPKFIATRTRRVLARNVRYRMEQKFRGEPDMVRALSEAAGVSRSTAHRVLEADVIGCSIDTLTQLANALHCDPYELLVPDRVVHRSPHHEGSPMPHEEL